MAIFTAGSLNFNSDIDNIRTQVYRLARSDLDSAAVKVSLRKHSDGINYVAFLPREKLDYENILVLASKNQGKSVIIFELDYKNVGVVLEDDKIIDYILDKPEEFATERGYGTLYADNTKGDKLVSLNLDKERRETRIGSFLIACTVVVTSGILYAGYGYLNATEINLTNRDALVKEYKQLVSENCQTSFAMTKKVDIVRELEKIEEMTKSTESTLQQISYRDDSLCAEVVTPNLNAFVRLLPPEAEIIKEDVAQGIVQYCNEKI
ncbi:MAG: hypothetical protein A2552_00420 [Sulfuricurvum sp. RIFOXYD2_FULL_44_160]|uniref:Uncharacterized protein n=2 Tax=Sulfuricurvum TaxID=286130 RepID=A0A2D3WCW9_9BACT|nr:MULTISPECIES: hypothetical protein [Sulfuricurvum]OHD91767.1 MAG: hypothetical protein A2517_01390 [Sulfuricurvum sp. RIFOXYD12_FULL_44_77]OHD92809.1 MAG: hypothetical protein A2552_00420 [Sulfuricurvum sp. RIFOXYD2_FULL_44_160]DAB38268.1 MAG TPA: hypothetical protein CFH83_06865 [Sulfuricurvum kujiense]